MIIKSIVVIDGKEVEVKELEENQSSIDACSRIIREALIRIEKTA